MSMSGFTAMSEPPRRFDVFTGTGRRRSFTAAEKAAIVAESYAGEDSVCGVARRHGLTPRQLFTWRRLARAPPSRSAERPLFVPAIVSPDAAAAPNEGRPKGQGSRGRRRRTGAAGIELEVGGVVVRVGRDADAGAIAAVIGALKASSSSAPQALCASCWPRPVDFRRGMDGLALGRSKTRPPPRSSIPTPARSPPHNPKLNGDMRTRVLCRGFDHSAVLSRSVVLLSR